MRPARLAAGFLLLWASSTEAAPAAPPPEDPLGVVSSVHGEVRIVRRTGDVEVARVFSTVEVGDRLELVGRQGSVLVVCRSDRLVRLRRGRLRHGRRLEPAVCARGIRLPAGAFAAVVPRGGRLQEVPGSGVLPAIDRDLPGEYDRLPVVVSPRATAVAERRPTVRWTEVSDSDLYVVSWDGPSGAAASLEPAELHCAPDIAFAGTVVCELPWPASWPELRTETSYFLRVLARLSDESNPRQSRESNRIRVLPPSEAERLRQAVTEVDGARRIDELTRQVVRGALFLEHGLLSEALLAYRRAAELQPSALALNTLGDIFRRVRLFRFARDTYHRSIECAETLAERAAAELGLGYVAYAWLELEAAERYFRKAETLYLQVGLASEAERAAGARAAAAERLPRQRSPAAEP